MKSKSKYLAIKDSLFKGDDIPEDIKQYRLSICDTCEWNSKNKSEKELDLLGKIRKTTLGEDKAFCTACSCQIDLKTGQGSEECGIVEKGLPPKWNRVYLEVIDKNRLSLYNLDSKKANLSLNEDSTCYLLDFGESDIVSKTVVLRLYSKENKKFEIIDASQSCGSCIGLEIIRQDDEVLLKIRFKFDKVIIGDHLKSINFSYSIDRKVYNNKIQLKAKRTS